MTGIVEVALFSDSVDDTVGFYATLLGTAPVATWPGGAIFSADGAKLLIHERGAQLPDGPPNEDHIALAVPDLDSTSRELTAEGLVLLVEPRDYAWGRSAYLRDPDGRLVELAQA